MNKTLRVAAIQATSLEGKVPDNLLKLDPLVAEAKSKGSELILLPEFIFTGYIMNNSIWDMAEPSQGPTVQWLKEQAIKHTVWIGTSFLEAAGNHFYNTFVLVNSEGMESIRVRKSKPAATEAFFFNGYKCNRVTETPFGRIGISICYENFLASTIKSLHKENADLVLIPMSAPTPTLNHPLKEKDVEEYNEAIRLVAAKLAKTLGVPTIMANKVGIWSCSPPWPFPKENSYFPGLSSIANADGEIISSLENEEGILIEEIIINRDKRIESLPKIFGKWSCKPPRLFKLFIIPEILGRLTYLLSIKRRKIAKKISFYQN